MTSNQLILALALATLLVAVLVAVWQIPRTMRAKRDREHSALARPTDAGGRGPVASAAAAPRPPAPRNPVPAAAGPMSEPVRR